MQIDFGILKMWDSIKVPDFMGHPVEVAWWDGCGAKDLSFYVWQF